MAGPLPVKRGKAGKLRRLQLQDDDFNAAFRAWAPSASRTRTSSPCWACDARLLFFIRASQPRSIKCTASRARLERLATDRSGGGELVDGVGKSLRQFIRANVFCELFEPAGLLGAVTGGFAVHRGKASTSGSQAAPRRVPPALTGSWAFMNSRIRWVRNHAVFIEQLSICWIWRVLMSFLPPTMMWMT